MFDNNTLMRYLTIFIAILLTQTTCFYSAISFAKQLYIPGQYFSLMNFSKNTEALSDYFDVSMDYTLSQAAFADQGNSIYDFFLFNRADYAEQEPCYYKTVIDLNNLYDQFQPCQGGCSTFDAIKNFSKNSTYLDFSSSDYNNISLIVDNTFYPCNQGAYQSEVYLYQVINLTIEQSIEYTFVIKIVFVILLQVFIFLFAYIVIMLQKLQNKKKKLKKIKQEEEDLEVLFSLERDRESN